MRIAIQHSFPNHPECAEAEWIRRAVVACERLGHEPVEVVTSDDIRRVHPDCVLLTHEFSAKITPYPTLGLMWSPPAFYAEDPVRRQTILSHDGHLCGSEAVARWVDDFLTGSGKPPAIADHIMLPSTPDHGPAGPLPDRLAIMYAGVHWDGSRHGAVFRALEKRAPLRLHGPPQVWEGHSDYAGTLPFDGTSVIQALREAGVALCLHKAAHRAANTPSMRLFEAAAAGVLIICDDFAFPRQWFRDSVLYVDPDLAPAQMAEQILAHLRWARQDPEGAAKLAKRANALFRHNLTLEAMLRPLPAFVERVRGLRGMVSAHRAKPEATPVVEYVVRIGSRPAEVLARALGSLAAQTYPAIALTIVQFHPVEGLEELLDKVRARFRWLNHILVPNNGSRSAAWWAGLRAVRGDLFGFLDDDDAVHPNHVESLMRALDRRPECGFAYSGLLLVQDEPGHYASPPQFKVGSAGKLIEERIDLFACREENFRDFLPTRNHIGHNGWLCRRALLDDEVLR
ncbi:MAG: glycosyltransferase, partial [Gemmobacter sp.]|nr:glycosyltransferase [Gemmobacter sp.]